MYVILFSMSTFSLSELDDKRTRVLFLGSIMPVSNSSFGTETISQVHVYTQLNHR